MTASALTIESERKLMEDLTGRQFGALAELMQGQPVAVEVAARVARQIAAVGRVTAQSATPSGTS